jgi:tRNA threonylcarbamoyladenosine biosynthesis protein TsaB
MIVLLDTSTSLCKLTFVNDGKTTDHEWQADRQLAKGLLGYVQQTLAQDGLTLKDITGIGIYRGPGSFTGLRIGLTVMNTLADSMAIPIVGVSGDVWQSDAVNRLRAGDNDQIVLPDYGADAHITKPRK